jgi:glycosyltransferase involved in cell wall biosynthesis
MHDVLLGASDADPTVLHDHGIWHLHNIVSTNFALRRRLPYVVSTHGMLEPWALAHKSMRKTLARRLYQDRILRNAKCLIASSDMELEGLRRAGCKNPIGILPIGIDCDIPVRPPRQPISPNVALFLSRIHPKKGLKYAIEAWHVLRPKNWRLNIVGPSESGHREELQELVNAYGLQRDISFHGAVSGGEKYQCFFDADIFLLPTHSENFGIVVAEALACGLPVLTTVGTPWRDLIPKNCGWYIDIGTAPLVAALREIFEIKSADLRHMGEMGRQWMLQDFQWQQIGSQYIALYEWVARRAPMPGFVYPP